MSPGALAASLSQHLLGYPLTYDTWVRSSAGEGIVCGQARWDPMLAPPRGSGA